MFQAFVIMLREGFEAFLIVAIIFAYLKRKNETRLLSAVYWGIAVSILASVGLGFLLQSAANQPLWEGVLGIVAAVIVTSLVIHMWKEGRFLKKHMEEKLGTISSKSTSSLAWTGTFLFTTFMISREGMETALMLIQVPQKDIFAGVGLGIVATAAFSYLWVKFSQYIDVKAFFQVTGIFLLLFVFQILIYSAHEFSEAGIFKGSDAFHNASEAFSPDGLYGKWFSVVMIGICALWLLGAWIKNHFNIDSRQKL